MKKMNGYRAYYDTLSYTAEQKMQIAQRAAKAADRAKQKKRGNHHALTKITAAAACLISVVTITAEAAGIPTPVSEILAPIFGGSVAQTEVIDKIGHPVDAWDSDNGVTITADAIIGDAYNACLVFTISRDDGTPLLPEGVTAEQLHLGGYSDVSLLKLGGSHGTARFIDAVPGDEKLQYVYFVSSDEPLNKGTAKATFGDLSCWDEETEQSAAVLEGEWKLRFDVDYEDSSISLGGGETFAQGDMTFSITDVCISPIAIRVSYEVDSEAQWSDAPSGQLPEEDRRQLERYMENVEILLTKTDGTVIDLSGAGGSVKPGDGKTDCVKSTVFSEVIPLEEMESICVGGVKFALSGENS